MQCSNRLVFFLNSFFITFPSEGRCQWNRLSNIDQRNVDISDRRKYGDEGPDPRSLYGVGLYGSQGKLNAICNNFVAGGLFIPDLAL